MSIVWVHELNTSESLKHNVAPGSQRLDIVRRFQVLTDDMDDGPITVASADDGTLAIPTPFSVYDKGNDRNENCVATNAECKRDKKQPFLWNVTISYTDAADFDVSGSQSGSLDLTCFTPSIRSWKVSYERTIWKAHLQLPSIDGSTADTFDEAMDKPKVMVANSAGKLFVDGIKTSRHAMAWEIRRYQWYFNQTVANAYMDVVNDDVFWGYVAGKVKFVAITGDRQTVNNSLIWLVSYEFHVAATDGWGEQLADNGMERWCKADGTIPTNVGGATAQCTIKDGNGDEIQAPTLLDGMGWIGGASDVLAPGGTPVIATWHHLPEMDFGLIKPELPTRQECNIVAPSLGA